MDLLGLLGKDFLDGVDISVNHTASAGLVSLEAGFYIAASGISSRRDLAKISLSKMTTTYLVC